MLVQPKAAPVEEPPIAEEAACANCAELKLEIEELEKKISQVENACDMIESACELIEKICEDE